MRAIFLCIFIATWAVSVGAAGKQTVDPNRGNLAGAGIANQPDNTGGIWADIDLSKTITYSAQQQTLHNIADDLHKASGVRIYAGRNKHDWHVRELRMNLAIKDLPLKDLMQSMARVLGLHWVHGSQNARHTYRLVGETLPARQNPEDNEAKELVERRQAFFSQFATLAHMSPSQLDRLQTTNPKLHALSKAPLGIPLAKVLARAPLATRALAEGQELVLHARDLPLAAANELLAAIRGSAAADAGVEGEPTAAAQSMPLNLDSLAVVINSADFGGDAGLGHIEVSCDGTKMDMTFPDTQPARSTVASNSDDDYPQDSARQTERTYPPDPLVTHPDEPDLHKKIRLALKQSPVALCVIQAALAEASGFSVISDDFEGDSKVAVPGGEIELKGLLDRITQPGEQNWQKRGAIIEIRDRNWAAKREKIVDQQVQSDPTPEFQ